MAILQRTVSNVSVTNPQTIIGQVLVNSQVRNDKFYTSKLLNYVESFEVDGVLKTVFFTEVNTNVNIGDRVFIVNGNYDSDSINNKYSKFSDGYRVLSTNGCRVLLDINYTGKKPYDEPNSRDFIFVHHIDNQKDFDYINSLKISIRGQNTLKSIFNGDIVGDNLVLDCQNILFTSTKWFGSQDPENLNGGVDPGSNGPSFWIRVDDGQNNNWLDVSSFVIGNRIIQNDQFSESGKLYIVGKNFEKDNFKFQSDKIYSFKNFTWVIDIVNQKPFLSKLNFRDGKFLGTHNDGVFGTYKKSIFWKDAVWNSGAMLNTRWISGFMNSKHTIDELSFSSKIQKVGSVSTVIQTEDLSNNRGFGYNFLENSIFFTYSISNGNFYNCLFATNSQYKSALDLYYNGGQVFRNVVNGGKYEMCEMYDFRGNGSYFLNSSIENSNINLSKLVSSEVINSSALKSYWSADGGVKILGADLWSFDTSSGLINSPNSNLEGTLKLYISEEDYFKLSRGDVFYLQKINKEIISEIITDEEKILLNIETKFFIDNFNDWDLVTNTKSRIKVSLSSSSENKWKYINREDPNNFIPTYGYTILENFSEFWYTIPSSKVKGLYDNDYDSNVGYDYNDVVYNDINFYQYIPYDRNVIPNLRRCINQLEFEEFVTGNRGAGLVGPGGISDWVMIGTYSGIWSINGVYEGFYTPEITTPYNVPSFASGSIVGDSENIYDSTKFIIFVGQYSTQVGYGSGSGIGIGLSNLGLIIKEDITGQRTNAYNIDIVDKKYFSQNLVTLSNFELPSINITTKSLAWYQDALGIYRPGTTNNIPSIKPSNVNNLFVDTVIGNGDFKSGVIEESTWLSGDNMNYSNNVIQIIPNGFLNIVLVSFFGKNILQIKLNDRKLTNYIAKGYDYIIGDYIWLKSIKCLINNQIIQIDGMYKVVKYVPSQSELSVESAEKIDKLQNLSSGALFFLSDGKTNNYNSIHKFNITKSKVNAGKFKRTGIDNTIFENDSFIKYKYPAEDIKNTELIRLVNIMFQDTNNEVKSGIVYKSHFVNDIFNGGTFYNSFFLNGTFSDGLFKSSVWTGGNFNGGKFVDSRESTLFSFDFDSSKNIKLWQGGNFNGGEFYNSLWVRGIFNGGRFYFSDWTGGIWNNGVLGSKNFRTMDTTMAYYGPTTSIGATHTIWNNGLVDNALIGGYGSIDWFGGKMIGGEFTSFGRVGNTYSIWHGGDFYGSSFTKLAWWKNGNFYSGKFLSEIGWDKVTFYTYSTDEFDYGWVNGNFLGGEFGNASINTNAVWYDGVMEGGVFQGRFWKDGLITNGKFYGNFEIQSEINKSLNKFGQGFYGLWRNGYVDSNVYNVKKDRIIANEDLEVNSRKTKLRPKIVDMNNFVWLNGTFSHELSTFNESIWLNGEFNSGNFNNSYFNPFVDLSLSNKNPNDYKTISYLDQLYSNVKKIVNDIITSNSLVITIQNIKDMVQQFNQLPQIGKGFVVDYWNDIGYVEPPYNISESFDWQTRTLSEIDPNNIDQEFYTTAIRIIDEELFLLDPECYVGLVIYINEISDGDRDLFIYHDFPKSGIDSPFSFNLSETCVWNGGNFNGGEFNYSNWNGGNFNDGVINGSVWKDGVFNYGYMNNCFWENGVWRNGNWNGTPFDSQNILLSDSYWEVSDKKVDQILKNINNYSQNEKIHLQNVMVTITEDIEVIHTFQGNDLSRWRPDEQ